MNIIFVSLRRRLVALIYEGLLLAAVSTVAGIVGGILIVLLPQTLHHRVFTHFIVSVLFILSWWWYCTKNWSKAGQTLPMKVWNIKLCSRNGSKITPVHIQLRFIWACIFVVFIPLLAYWSMRHWGIAPKLAAITALFWWILPWGFALFNKNHQFLYDYLAGTALLDSREITRK